MQGTKSQSQTFSTSLDDTRGLAESWMQTSSEVKSIACTQKMHSMISTWFYALILTDPCYTIMQLGKKLKNHQSKITIVKLRTFIEFLSANFYASSRYNALANKS